MNVAARLLRIESRHNLALLFFPIITLGVGYMAYEALPLGVWLWPETVVAVQGSIVLIGPLAAGLGVWSALRNRRRGIDELLASTPYPPARRDLARWLATVLWVTLAYFLAAAGVLTIVALNGAWGVPVLWPLVLGIVALTCAITVGYAVGYYIPSLFTAPIMVVAVYWLQGIAVFNWYGKSIQYLSPVPDALDYSVFYGVLPNVFPGQSLWLFGLVGVGLSAVALRADRGSRLARVSFAGCVAMGVAGVVLLLFTPAKVSDSMAAEASVPYKAKCVERAMPVCMHPAYADLMDETTTIVSKVSEPFVGLPGGPVRAEQTSGTINLSQDGILNFSVYDETSNSSLALEVALVLAQNQDSAGDPESIEALEAQIAVVAWSLKRAGYEDDQASGLVGEPEKIKAVETAATRFGELDEDERQAWLRGNYERLRAGEVKLSELP